MTGIEIENGEIRLIKWFIGVNPITGGTLFVSKELLGKLRKLRDLV
jgi:hypothetical protein